VGRELGIVLMYVAGMALCVAEIFLPGVVLGIVGVFCVLGSIYFAFMSNAVLGWTLTGITVASVPLLIVMWVKVLNRVMAIKHTEAGYSGTSAEDKALLGKEGVVLTKLRPAGSARIGDVKVDVVSEGEIIEPNARVRVVEVKGNRVVVRPVRG
jgi:membrane-bound serine protease (ClpP class)